MKVAIINDKIDIKKSGWRENSDRLAERLRSRDHEADVSSSVGDLPHPLGYYEIAVAHPSLQDVPLIVHEVQTRPEFRWIIYSGNDERFRVSGIEDSDQVYGISLAITERGYERLISLVEEGW